MKTNNYVIATLGKNSEDVTCSILAAKSIGKHVIVNAFDRFETAAETMLVNDSLDAFLVPGAYPKVNSFIMDKRLEVVMTFIFPIPPLVFAAMEEHKMYSIMYNHPATNALLNEVIADWGSHFNVDSNSDACLEVLKDPKTCAITNAECAKKYGLKIIQILRQEIKMPFLLFQKKIIT